MRRVLTSVSEDAESNDNDDAERRSFYVFTASIGSLVPPVTVGTNAAAADNMGSNPTTTIQTAQGLRDNHALRRLQKLMTFMQDHSHQQQQQQQNQQHITSYDTFVLRGPYNFAASNIDDEDVWYQTLTLSATIASAIVQVFQQQRQQQQQQQYNSNNTIRRPSWKQLQIWDCEVNEPLLQVLQAAKKEQLFSSWEFRNCHAFMTTTTTTSSLLSLFVLNNPGLQRLRLDRVTMNRSLTNVLAKLLIQNNDDDDDDKDDNNDDLSSSSSFNYHHHHQQLQCLELNHAIPDEDGMHILARALQRNHTLKELILFNWNRNPSPISGELIDALDGHISLQVLHLEQICFASQDPILALGRILQNSNCQITHLYLDQCQLLTPSRYIGPLHMEFVADALMDHNTVCTSLTLLSLRHSGASSRDLQRLLRMVYHHCPNLLELDVSYNRIERIFWNPMDLTTTKETTATTVIPNLDKRMNPPRLRTLWLTRNPILHNRFRARTSTDNVNMERLLTDFPALGRLVHHSHFGRNNNNNNCTKRLRYMRFSFRVHTLLAFQYATRGQLQQQQQQQRQRGSQLHLSLLLTRIWNRIPHGVTNTLHLWGRDSEENKFRQTCQASILFVLLRQYPSLIRRDTCPMDDDVDQEGNVKAEQENDVMPWNAETSMGDSSLRTKSRRKRLDPVKRRKLQ